LPQSIIFRLQPALVTEDSRWLNLARCVLRHKGAHAMIDVNSKLPATSWGKEERSTVVARSKP